MNAIIIGIVIIIITSIICYTIYKIKTFKYSNEIIKKEVDSILDRYDKYEHMVNNKVDDYWKFTVSNEDFVKVLNAVKRIWNN